METAALWKPGKNKLRFSPVPTALGKLDQERRVFHSYHSPYGCIYITAKTMKTRNKNALSYAQQALLPALAPPSGRRSGPDQ
jgi:hypothetical protein